MNLAGGPAPNPEPREERHTGTWVAVVVAALLLIIYLIHTHPWGPHRSVSAYCHTWQAEGNKLHNQWKQQLAQGDPNDPFSSVPTVFGAPKDLATFFDRLEKVSPDDIKDDVARERDAWQAISDNLGANASNPASFFIAALMVSGQTAGAESRIDTWTRTHCTTAK